MRYVRMFMMMTGYRNCRQLYCQKILSMIHSVEIVIRNIKIKLACQDPKMAPTIGKESAEA